MCSWRKRYTQKLYMGDGTVGGVWSMVHCLWCMRSLWQHEPFDCPVRLPLTVFELRMTSKRTSAVLVLYSKSLNRLLRMFEYRRRIRLVRCCCLHFRCWTPWPHGLRVLHELILLVRLFLVLRVRYFLHQLF